MAGLASRSRSPTADIWPGFVDALASLLMVIIFLLTVFVLAQFFLSELLTGRDQALMRLETNIAELTEVLGMERRTNVELRGTVSRLSSQLQASTTERDRLTLRLSDLQATAAEAQAEARRLKGEMEVALKEISAGKEMVRVRLLEIVSLKVDIAALRKLRKTLEQRVGTLAAGLKDARADAGALRDRSKELVAQLADQRQRTLLTQKELKARDIRIEELSAAELDQRRRAVLLNNQIAALRQELAKLAAVLGASEKKAREQNIQIANLGRRLNAALAAKVEELSRYRSEFFGKLRQVLGSRSDVRVVGDRFVFQSEVLFASGDAALNAAGMAQLQRLAGALKEISAKIPANLNWVLRVDGHTDIRPISTARYPSNWELSTARALSVVRFLISRGVDANRLAATGFGRYQPIDPGNTEASHRRNRRIELKLTQR
ncbi:MAG: peptidoglycan -binding protein [Alphaproteobacteria bacterium]|nr:peptidoglycan -binding protein [Alphaproteobacteria bacterium]